MGGDQISPLSFVVLCALLESSEVTERQPRWREEATTTS